MSPFLLFASKGDNHPVMLVPGYMASDTSMQFIFGYLKVLGYDPYHWELGQNHGASTVGPKCERLIARAEEIQTQTGRKVSLVGWSLGGSFARKLAQLRPDLVRQVITLGAPVLNSLGASAGNVPSTSIYSRFDGVVPWTKCQIANTTHSENIEIIGSHTGLGANPSALWIIADKLTKFKEGRPSA